MPRAPFAGVMSGTSLDGVDAVIAEFVAGVGAFCATLGAAHVAFPPDLRRDLLALQASGADELVRAARAANALADCYAEAILGACRAAGIAPGELVAAGVHGQTVRHRPHEGWTLQLNNPARVAEHIGGTVVADFRSRDIAAGGQGAPLVPAFHDAVFGGSGIHRVVVNIGGIANITDLPIPDTANARSNASDRDGSSGSGSGERSGSSEGSSGSDSSGSSSASGARIVRGFDTGPGNVLLDEWCARHRGTAFDDGGAWAASGRVHPALLDALLAEPFFAAPPPKSTGRDLFHGGWLDTVLARVAWRRAPEDVEATLCEFTARTVADAIRAHAGTATEILVCGGGARNATLLQQLARDLAPRRVTTTAAAGIATDHVEALAFAWLAREALAGRPGNLPAATGAAGPRVLGAIYPR